MGSAVERRSAFTTGGPKVRLGTNGVHHVGVMAPGPALGLMTRRPGTKSAASTEGSRTRFGLLMSRLTALCATDVRGGIWRRTMPEHLQRKAPPEAAAVSSTALA
jgi:hypothetical protein